EASPVTYDHIHWKIRDPVRSPRVKPMRGRLVVRWVTTGEHRLLYVLFRGRNRRELEVAGDKECREILLYLRRYSKFVEAIYRKESRLCRTVTET
ncbi:hypothetical protein BBK36DRAFT_1131276, partial [Trichoderma citrinoviride]